MICKETINHQSHLKKTCNFKTTCPSFTTLSTSTSYTSQFGGAWCHCSSAPQWYIWFPLVVAAIAWFSWGNWKQLAPLLSSNYWISFTIHTLCRPYTAVSLLLYVFNLKWHICTKLKESLELRRMRLSSRSKNNIIHFHLEFLGYASKVKLTCDHVSNTKTTEPKFINLSQVVMCKANAETSFKNWSNS